jgi:hypothetical protein
VNRIPSVRVDWTQFVDRLADYIDHAAEHGLADGNGNWSSRINSRHTTNHSFGRLERNRADPAFAEMLLHFDDDVDIYRYIEPFACDMKCLVDRWLLSLIKLDVNRRTDNL